MFFVLVRNRIQRRGLIHQAFRFAQTPSPIQNHEIIERKIKLRLGQSALGVEINHAKKQKIGMATNVLRLSHRFNVA